MLNCIWESIVLLTLCDPGDEVVEPVNHPIWGSHKYEFLS
jgi:hypothetical protein